MNIIEAFQAAENGALITNDSYKLFDRFLKYMGNGEFFEYELVNGIVNYKWVVREFSLANIISTSWSILNNNPFAKQQNEIIFHPDSDIDAELYHDEIANQEKRECIYCNHNTNSLTDGMCHTCYKKHN